MQARTSAPARPRKPSLKLRLGVALLSPLLFLLLVEWVLRLLGVGLPTHFFVPWTSNGQRLYLSNPHFCESFVPKARSRAPESSVLPAKSDPNHVRIFVLGGSAANGDPAPAYGFCRQLEFLLNASSPQNSFTVVNAAVTSMNSHVARRIAQDCARLQPDVFIVYMGNNEVVGPYGPSTLPAALYGSDAFIDASIAAKKDLRLGQLIMTTAAKFKSSQGASDRWLGMEAFLHRRITCDDPKMQACYDHFKTNLRDIISTARRAGAVTLLCTVPTNLAACPPFASVHRRGLTTAQKTLWDQAFKAGRQLQADHHEAEALAAYQKAWNLDNTYADLAYSMGSCQLALNHVSAARSLLSQARDQDALRFRADSRINQIVRQPAEPLHDQGVTLLDLVSVLEQANQGRPLGDSLLLDHVHLNVRANFLVAQAALAAIARQVPRLHLQPLDETDESWFQRCQQRLQYDYDVREQLRLALLMYYRKTRPPFVDQLDHEQEMTALRTDILQLQARVKQSPSPTEVLAAALKQYPDDVTLIRRYGDLLVQENRAIDAISLYDQLLPRRPYDMDLRSAQAGAYITLKDRDQALSTLMSTEAPFHYSRTEALEIVGGLCIKQQWYAQVLSIYQELHQLQPHNVEVIVSLASAQAHQGDLQSALQLWKRALALNPASVPAMINLGNYYAQKNQTQQAHDWFARAMQADPYDYIPHFNLGMQTVKLGKIRDGTKLITESVILKPDFVQGYDSLARLYQQFNKPDIARQYNALKELFSP